MQSHLITDCIIATATGSVLFMIGLSLQQQLQYADYVQGHKHLW